MACVSQISQTTAYNRVPGMDARSARRLLMIQELTYVAAADGNRRDTFRHTNRDAAAQGGAAGRAKGAKDSGDQHIEPTVYVEKYDPGTGAIIEDKEAEGHWRAFMVTFPLRETVRGVQVAEVAYRIPTSP